MNQRFIRALAAFCYRTAEIVTDIPYVFVAVCSWIVERFESKKK